MPTVFSPTHHFKGKIISIHNPLIKLLEDAFSREEHCTLNISGINVTRELEASICSWEQLGFCHISTRLYLLKLIFYIMESKKIIIKMDVNETCILENSLTNYSQRIYKGWQIFHLIYSSTQTLFPKVSTDHPINIHLLDL